jgi:hypothetical protein
MRIAKFFYSVILIMAAFPAAQAQSTGQQSLAGTLDIYVFPAKGQDAKLQSEDEAACYQWAVSNTGTDPFAAQQQQAANAQQAEAAQQQAAQAGKGSGARGAVGGAAVGALVGEIADDDAGKGAAYGAAAGLVAGRRRGRQASAQAQQQVEQEAQRAQGATAEQAEGFKKAFSVCLEAKKYVVKF